MFFNGGVVCNKLQWWGEPGMVTVPYHEGGFSCGAVRPSVMGKFHEGNEFCPIILLEVTEDV